MTGQVKCWWDRAPLWNASQRQPLPRFTLWAAINALLCCVLLAPLNDEATSLILLPFAWDMAYHSQFSQQRAPLALCRLALLKGCPDFAEWFWFRDWHLMWSTRVNTPPQCLWQAKVKGPRLSGWVNHCMSKNTMLPISIGEITLLYCRAFSKSLPQLHCSILKLMGWLRVCESWWTKKNRIAF